MNNRLPTRPAVCLLLLLTGILSALPQLRAQSGTGGSVAGQISGISGNHFRALVTLRNTATGATLEALSDIHGNFRFAEVAPGLYSARVNAPGTAPWHAYDITVDIGRTTLLDPHMTVAFLDHPRHRRADYAPQADLTPAVSSNIDQTFIDSLPSPNGHWSAIAALAAGSAPDPSGTSALTFRGLSPLMNGVTLDGVDNTIAFRGRERGTMSGGYATARGAISQFRVSTSNFSAEYGRAAGGVINSVTRSGSNTLHATLSFRDRNAAWGAANAFARVMQAEPIGTTITATGAPVQYLNGQPITYIDQPYKAPDRRLQFGFHAGGPIRRDKLFWFFAADYYDRNHPAIARAREPETFFAPPSAQTIQTLAARISTSTNPIYTNCATTPIDLNAQASCAYETILNQLNGVLGNVPRTSRQIIFFPKIDWRVNRRIHLTGEYNLMRRNSPNGVLTGASAADGIGSFGNSRASENAAVAALEYFLAPGVLSNARYQYSRDLLSQLAASPTPFEQQFAANIYSRAPQISIDSASGFTFGTLTSENKSQYPLETRQQFVDAITWIHNRHAFRFGYDYNHVTDSVNGVANENREYSYSSLANFAADFLASDSCDGTTTGAGDYPCYSWFRQTVGSSVWNFQTADYAAFLTDDWKLAPRLTLSLGVRYDYERLPDTNKLVANPDIPQTAYLPHDRDNFGPRVGFAWDVTGSGRTVLRGGYGLYYGRVSNATVFSALTSTAPSAPPAVTSIALSTPEPRSSRTSSPQPQLPTSTPTPATSSAPSPMLCISTAASRIRKSTRPSYRSSSASATEAPSPSATWPPSDASYRSSSTATSTSAPSPPSITSSTFRPIPSVSAPSRATSPCRSITSASIRPTGPSPTSSAKRTHNIRRPSSASPATPPAPSTSTSPTPTPTPSTTTRTRRPSPASATSTIPPISNSNTGLPTSTSASEPPAASSPTSPGASMDSSEESSTDTRFPRSASGAPAAPTPCAPRAPSPRPYAQIMTGSLREASTEAPIAFRTSLPPAASSPMARDPPPDSAPASTAQEARTLFPK
ncbi:MAG: TonB-dependent receptor [Acidobacteriaceae bacterium]